jgi:hypothetical protein
MFGLRGKKREERKLRKLMNERRRKFTEIIE